MTVDEILKNLQRYCDDFISDNSERIFNSLQVNRTDITTPYSEFEVKDIPPNTWGVYVFYLRLNCSVSNYEDLCNFWETNLSDKRLHCPKANKGNFKKIEPNGEHVFYVGKSENLAGRISQHIHQRTAYTTYGLKISEHDRLADKASFMYSYYPLKTDPKDNKDGLRCLIVTLERYLRQQLKPLIGKQ